MKLWKPKQILQRLPMALGQVKRGSISEHLQKKLDKFFFVLSKTNHWNDGHSPGSWVLTTYIL